ncbi:MAG: GxxExxY protein [Bacteroidota bacterium]|nr:GxxExxY protein [Bacteroidota bacterium]
MEKEEYNRLASEIVSSCIEVHRHMGPGLLESVYEECLIKEFELRGIFVESQVAVPLYYKGFRLDKRFEVDILVEREIVLELKAVLLMHPVFECQLLSHLKLADKRLGYLINFNVPLMKDGIRRRVNNF